MGDGSLVGAGDANPVGDAAYRSGRDAWQAINDRASATTTAP
jgi:hypothetical protein